MQQSATDPTTGTIDMDCIQIGVSSSDRRARDQLSNEVLTLLKSEFNLTLHYNIHSCTTIIIIRHIVFLNVNHCFCSISMVQLSVTKSSTKHVCILQLLERL